MCGEGIYFALVWQLFRVMEYPWHIDFLALSLHNT